MCSLRRNVFWLSGRVENGIKSVISRAAEMFLNENFGIFNAAGPPNCLVARLNQFMGNQMAG
jgi:hypothetical protein